MAKGKPQGGQHLFEDMPPQIEKEPVARTLRAKKVDKDAYTEWLPPFKRPDGLVWTHVGYGEWEPLQVDDPRAVTELAMCRTKAYLKGYQWRLLMFIDQIGKTPIVPPSSRASRRLMADYKPKIEVELF